MKQKVKELQFQVDTSDNAVNYLKQKDSFLLQSPTGSGKTFITSLIIQKMLQDPILSAKNLTFIFVAPSVGKLDHQGFVKISDYLHKGWVSGFNTSYIGSKDTSSKGAYLQNIDRFKPNMVYFVGWSLFGKGSNLTKIDSEKNNIFRVIENTKKSGTEVVLIIDEAHREVQSNSDTKMAAISAINPYKRVEVSATLDNPDYKVTLDQVRSESAIKKNVMVSFGESDALSLFDTEDEMAQMIRAAKEKQEEVKRAYFKKNISLTPLILIQIPDNQKLSGINTDDYYLLRIKNALKDHGYVEGKNLAIWLNDDKTTKIKEEITGEDSPFEVLVFKQAIATGWDIPRANILIRIREPKSPKFDIQTLGRILRNPFFKYYNNDLIDNAFVFTRDTKYASKIEKEDFVISEKSLISVDLSEKGRASGFSIKQMLFNEEVDMLCVVDNALKEFENDYVQKLIECINKCDLEDDNSFRASFEIASEYAQDASLMRAKVAQAPTHTSINFNASKDMFTIFLKYKAITAQNKSFAMLFDEIANLLSGKFKVTKKDYYKFVQNYIFSSYFGEESLFDIVKRLIDKHVGILSSKEYVDYFLPLQMQYKESEIVRKWDEVNTYELSFGLNNADKWSEVERKFFIEIFELLKYIKKPHVHWFRNNVDSVSYKIDYLNNTGKISAFYPDFILVNDSTKKVYVVDTKGHGENNIDRQSVNKFRMAWEEQGKLSKGHDVEFYKASVNKNAEFEFKGNNTTLSKTEFLNIVTKD